MKTSILRRSTAVAALAVTMSFGLTACGGSDDSTASDPAAASESSDDTSSDMSPSEDMSSDTESSMGSDPAAQTYGDGCAQVPTDGAGSFTGMATEPVATAASANPLLKSLVGAVGEADLVDTLNNAQGITVFAPADPAFAAVPKKALNALLKDKKMLQTVLTHHVVEGQLTPDQLTGTLTTLAGDKLTVNGSGESATIGTEKATVLCGNIPTANATVYVIDKVLMPTG